MNDEAKRIAAALDDAAVAAADTAFRKCDDDLEEALRAAIAAYLLAATPARHDVERPLQGRVRIGSSQKPASFCGTPKYEDARLYGFTSRRKAIAFQAQMVAEHGNHRRVE